MAKGGKIPPNMYHKELQILYAFNIITEKIEKAPVMGHHYSKIKWRQ